MSAGGLVVWHSASNRGTQVRFPVCAQSFPCSNICLTEYLFINQIKQMRNILGKYRLFVSTYSNCAYWPVFTANEHLVFFLSTILPFFFLVIYGVVHPHLGSHRPQLVLHQHSSRYTGEKTAED